MKNLLRILTIVNLVILSISAKAQIINIGFSPGVAISKQPNYQLRTIKKFYAPGGIIEINRITQGVQFPFAGYSSFSFGYYHLGVDSFDFGYGGPRGTYTLSIRDWRLTNSHEIAFKNESFTMWIGYSLGVRSGRRKIRSVVMPQGRPDAIQSSSNGVFSAGLFIAASYEFNSFFLFARYDFLSGGALRENYWVQVNSGIFIPIKWY